MTDSNTPLSADETPAPVEPTPAPKRSRKRLYVIVAAAAVLVIGGGIGVFAAVSSANAAAEKRTNELAALNATREKALDAFQDAADLCGVNAFATVTDGGETMALDGAGRYEFTGMPFQKTECVLRILDAPSRVATLMGQTRALDGRQNDSWDSQYGTVDVSWSYHPDNGLDSLLSLELSDELQDIPTE